MSHPHLAVIGGADNERVVAETQLLQGVQQFHQPGIGCPDQVAIEIDIALTSGVVRQPPQSEAEPASELLLGARLGRQILIDCRREAKLSVQPVLRLVTAILPGLGVGENVVGIDQGDDEEEGLLPGCDIAQVGQCTFSAFLHRTIAGHDTAVVVGGSTAELADVAILASVGRVPAPKAIHFQVLGCPRRGVVRCGHRLAEVPLSLVGHLVTGVGEHCGHVRQVRWEHALTCGEPRPERERVRDAVLRWKEPCKERGAAGGAHAARAEGALKGKPVLAQAHAARQVLCLPALRKVLNGSLLIGEEEDHVHARCWRWC